MGTGGFTISVQQFQPRKKRMRRAELGMLLNYAFRADGSLRGVACKEQHPRDADLRIRAIRLNRERLLKSRLGIIKRPLFQGRVGEQQKEGNVIRRVVQSLPEGIELRHGGGL